MTPLFRKFLGINWVLFINMMLLLAWGIWAIYNASSFREGPALAFKWRDQVVWAMIGMTVYFGTAITDYKWMRWGAPFLYIAGIAGLIAAKFLAADVKGAKSIIQIGGLNFQPSQLAIAATIISL